MCYAPNIMIGRKFKGGMKKYCKENDVSNEQLTGMLKSGLAKIIPCGQCLECRLNYAKNWAARCEVESYYFNNNHFITLTYDDEHVPVINKITGEVYRGLKSPLDYYNYGKHYEVLNLWKKDFQDFMKRLRDYAQRHDLIEDKKLGIRYFYCGEYGSGKHRPHYHAIIFGLKLPDLKFHYMKKGYYHFTSEIIAKCWGNGLVDIGGVDYKSCQYVARYIVKKQKGKDGKEWYRENALNPEFINMSLKPSIGLRYYEEHREDIYSKDLIYLKEGRKQKPCKLYDLKEDEYQCMKEFGLTDEEMGIYHEDRRRIQAYNRQQKRDCEKIAVPKMESTAMKELKRERRTKAMDALWAKLEKTALGVLEYLDVQKDKYEQQHKIATDRPCNENAG